MAIAHNSCHLRRVRTANWSSRFSGSETLSYSWLRGAEIHLKIYDRQDKVLYEEMIGSDGAWSELDNAFEDIRFDDDVIRISQLWGRSYLIKQSELRR